MVRNWITLIWKWPIEPKNIFAYPNVPKTLLHVIYEDVDAHLASLKYYNYYSKATMLSLKIFIDAEFQVLVYNSRSRKDL